MAGFRDPFKMRVMPNCSGCDIPYIPGFARINHTNEYQCKQCSNATMCTNPICTKTTYGANTTLCGPCSIIPFYRCYSCANSYSTVRTLPTMNTLMVPHTVFEYRDGHLCGGCIRWCDVCHVWINGVCTQCQAPSYAEPKPYSTDSTMCQYLPCSPSYQPAATMRQYLPCSPSYQPTASTTDVNIDINDQYLLPTPGSPVYIPTY